MGETITLPKSGVVFSAIPGCGDMWGLPDSLFQVIIGGGVATWAGKGFVGPHDECIAWLDARVLETRAALTPPGHVIVGPEARERIAEALVTVSEGHTVTDWQREVADAVLRAIGVRGGA